MAPSQWSAASFGRADIGKDEQAEGGGEFENENVNRNKKRD